MTAGSAALDRTSAPAASTRMISTLTGALMALWIGVIPFIDLAQRPKIGIGIKAFSQSREVSPALAAALLMVVLAGAIPPLVAALGSSLDFRRAKYFAFGILGLCLSIPLSYLALYDLRDAAYVAIVYYVFVCMILLISADVDSEILLRSFFTSLVLVNCASMIAVLIDHDFAWGRLMGRTAPNYWGAIAQTTLIAVIAMRGWLFRGGAIALSLYVLSCTQSRGSMLALVVAYAGVAGILFFAVRGKAWLWLALGLMVLVAVIVSGDYVTNDLMMLSDPLRGVGSGATGRAHAWAETWDLFAAHPWVGVGYRQHEQYLLSDSSAHNGYLATLAETGIFGFMAYIVFIFGALGLACAKVLRKPTAPRVACMAFLLAYIFTGLVERVGLNTGNLYSLVLIVAAALAWRIDGDAAAAPPAASSPLGVPRALAP